MLQHAYFTCLLNTDPEASQTADLVNAVLDFVVEATDPNLVGSQWDGYMIHLEDEHAVRIACWKAITDEWFDVAW